MKFLDQAKVFVSSGAGGGGGVSFRREKFVPRGGPDGGDGGRGGSVRIKAVSGLNTLIDFRYKQHFKAGTGEMGKGENRHGRKGSDVVLSVPIGTQILDEHAEDLLFDLTKEDQEVIFLRGGRGGRGNAAFKSATNQAPRYAEKGGDKQETYIWLRLKLLADVGLIGMPNAGKSSLLNTMTMAKSKVGDYPFTTLYPQLGVLHLPAKDLILADIPGLIEGASEGKGLGHRFLGHIERCAMVLHLLDVSEVDCIERYRAIRDELQRYDPELAQKPEQVVLSKADTLTDDQVIDAKDTLEAAGIRVDHIVSSFRSDGIAELVDSLAAYFKPTPQEGF